MSEKAKREKIKNCKIKRMVQCQQMREKNECNGPKNLFNDL